MKDCNAGGPLVLDATTELMKQQRRRTLLRVAQGEGIRLQEILLGLAAILMMLAAWLEPRYAAVSAIVACAAICSIIATRTSRQLGAVCELLEMRASE